MTIEDMAGDIALQKNGNKKEVFIDPLTIMLICSILSVLFSALRAWLQYKQNKKTTGESVKEVCLYHPYLMKREIRKAVKSKMNRKDYAKEGENTINATFQCIRKSSARDLDSLLNSGRWIEV